MSKNYYNLEFEDWVSELLEVQRSDKKTKAFVGDRPYRHIDSRVSLRSLDTNEAKVINYLKDPSLLGKYSFYPFLRHDKKTRKYNKKFNLETKRNEVVIGQKVRPIMYASHMDSCIYGFYAYMLKKKYETELINKNLESSVIAYRKIPRIDKPQRNKSNIDFAKDIFEEVKSLKNMAILCVDIKDFFGSMDHALIKDKWANLLGHESLPAGHSTVYKNITNYRYIFLNEAKGALGLGKTIKGKFVYRSKAKRTGALATSKKYNEVLNNDHYIHKNKKRGGIPQGSPISDIIANLYLLSFDEKLSKYIHQFDNSIYKRYSDDILVVCPQAEAKKAYLLIKEMLLSEKLFLNAAKSELFFIDSSEQSLIDQTRLIEEGYTKNKKAIQYLGFEFDLKDIHLRSSTVANHYRKIKRKFRAQQNNSQTAHPKTHKRSSNRLNYINLTIKRLSSPRLSKQKITIDKRISRLRRQSKKS